MSPWLTVLVVTLSVASTIGLIAFVIWSRTEGSVVASRLPRLRKKRTPAHAVVRDALFGKGKVVSRGRWAWDYDGDAYFAFLWMWWRVPARWSMAAFRIVLLDKQVNGG